MAKSMSMRDCTMYGGAKKMPKLGVKKQRAAKMPAAGRKMK